MSNDSFGPALRPHHWEGTGPRPLTRARSAPRRPAATLHRQAFHGRASATLSIVGVVQILGLPLSRAATAPKAIPDGAITKAVEQALVFDRGVFPDTLDVATMNGIVTLSGSVSNILARDRALRIAQSIRGVRATIDRIDVAALARPDADILRDIRAALVQDPATESYQVAVSVRKAVVSLSGSVGSYAEKQLVARIAKSVKGVKRVVNDVAIDYKGTRTDSEIAGDVTARLQWDIWIDGDLLSATVQDGKVALVGEVGSAVEKSRAIDDAWVNGVVGVDGTGLIVQPWFRDAAQRKQRYAVRSDGEIEQAVRAALRYDPRVSAFSPDVTVEGGVVLLGGSVGNLKAKTSAEQDVRNTLGVAAVDNLLEVRPSGPATDAEIKDDLTAVLHWDPLLGGSAIEVAVVNHVAYLSGAVASNHQRVEAQDAASRTKGVISVVNHLKVEPEVFPSYDAWPDYLGYGWPNYDQPPDHGCPAHATRRPFLSDERIKKNIDDALFWSPFVRRKDINVTVDDGVATLTGTVRTWIAWAEAGKDAHQSGATSVLNRIKVQQGRR